MTKSTQKNRWASKAIVLARVSTEDQAKDGHFSIPAQLRILREYVSAGGHFKTIKETVVEIPFDESASRDRRRKFEEAIEIVEQSAEPIAIVVERVDRFQRSFRESVRFEELRREGRVELHFVSQGLFLHRNSKASDLQIWDMHVLMARAFVLAISDNVKRSIREKLERGLFPGYAPAGYKNVTRKIDQDVFKKEIEPDWPQLNLIKKAFKLMLTGKYTVEALADLMRRQGLLAKTKRHRVEGKLIEKEKQLITAGGLYEILVNPFYTGKFYFRNPDTGERELYPEGEKLATNYPAIIDWQTYEKAQNVLSSRDPRASGMEFHDFKFAKMLKCGFCGCTMTAENQKRFYKPDHPSANRVFYHCTSYRKANDPDFYKKKFGDNHSGVTVYRGEKVIRCPQRWWKQEEIEQEILSAFEKIKFNDELYTLFKEKIAQDFESRIEAAENQLKGLRAEQTKLNDLYSALVRKIALEKDEALEAAFKMQFKEVQTRLKEIGQEIETWEEAKEADYEDVIQTLGVCRNLKESYMSLDVQGQRELLRALFSEIIAFRGTIPVRKIPGRKAEADYINFVWREEFQEFWEIGLWEWTRKEDKENMRTFKFTKKKIMEASPFM
jgi:DNA invertase Pin-like site-specific DNA recombinase